MTRIRVSATVTQSSTHDFGAIPPVSRWEHSVILTRLVAAVDSVAHRCFDDTPMQDKKIEKILDN
jgi:hypothetical protein